MITSKVAPYIRFTIRAKSIGPLRRISDMRMTFNKKSRKSCQKGPKHHEKEGKCMNFDQKSRNSCFFLKILMPGIYQRFSPFPIFNVDPHYTGMDATVEHNIETRGGKGEFYFETRVWNYDSISQRTKNFILVLLNGAK